MPVFLSKITFQFYQNNSLQRDINNNTLFLLIDMSLKQKTQNGLLMDNLMEFYKNKNHLKYMMNVISGETNISLRIVDWFVYCGLVCHELC
jgi:hypothetical protein